MDIIIVDNFMKLDRKNRILQDVARLIIYLAQYNNEESYAWKSYGIRNFTIYQLVSFMFGYLKKRTFLILQCEN